MHTGARRSTRLLSVSCSIALLLVAVGCGWYQRREHLKRASELYALGKYPEAIQEYEQALEGDPDAWPANYGIAISNIALYKGAPTPEKKDAYAAAARAALEKCMQLEAPSPEKMQKVKDFHAGLLIVSGDSETALQMAEEQLAQDPNNPQLLLRLAGMHGKAGNFQKSLEYHERRAALEPDNPAVWFGIGTLCWDRSAHGGVLVGIEEREALVAKGLEALERADRLAPNSFDTLVYINLMYRERAKVHNTLGRTQEAAADIAKADEFRNRAQAMKKAS
jgi:tetratricopeptide (TPR) repeat protein